MIQDMPPIAKPDTRAHFNAKADVLPIRIGTNSPIDYCGSLQPKRFPSGAVGWTGKGLHPVYIQVGDKWFICDIAVTLKVKGSKKW